MGHLDRLKQRLVREAVRENRETIRSRPPRGLRRSRRWRATLFRHYRSVVGPALFLIAIALFASGGSDSPATPSRAVSLQALSHRLAASGASLDPVAFPLGVKRVVLDPGHGGLDPGAQADPELAEKEVTLDVARRLRGLLQESGFDVVMTRDGDETVPVRERARRANVARADLFVSIHVNAIPSAEACGVETYTVGPTDDPPAQRLAGVENRDSGYSLADFRRLLDGVYVHLRQQESTQLAETLQRGLVTYLGDGRPAPEGGVKTAPFMVLVSTEMPGVLVELSCLSNPEQAARLSDPDHRQSIARGLYVGLSAYAEARNRPGRPGRPRGSS
ncbi:MAG TPA: N-acetylmuramoyl-L-alanine amidase [Methylomirabilota bacterium]|nr:N-acetylmuramoyl-L-alanine amidase [Methylomirabilota bacterium]